MKYKIRLDPILSGGVPEMTYKQRWGYHTNRVIFGHTWNQTCVTTLSIFLKIRCLLDKWSAGVCQSSESTVAIVHRFLLLTQIDGSSWLCKSCKCINILPTNKPCFNPSLPILETYKDRNLQLVILFGP